MRDKGLIEAEIKDASEQVADAYENLGKHYIERADLIRESGVTHPIEVRTKLNQKLRLIQMQMATCVARLDQLKYELDPDACPECGVSHDEDKHV